MYAYRNAEVRSRNYGAVEINKYYIFLCARASVGEGMRVRACMSVCVGTRARACACSPT
jgi:hypothetical protein